MSTIVWGVFKLEKANISEEEKISLAFELIIVAAEQKIAVDLGDKVKPWVYKKFKKLENSQDSLQFQLTNHSLNPNVEALFVGEGNEVYGESWGESLDSRMTRIQQFFEGVLNITSICQIVLYIDSGFGEESGITIRVDDFKKKMLEMFIQNNNMAPNVKLIIRK
jgi:hypothetical protein